MFRKSLIRTSILLSYILVAQCVQAQEKTLTIGLIGDSTVASMYGWGPAFAEEVNDHVTVLNYAKNGATLDSLSKRLDVLIKQKPDFMLIQFGHNDMKRYDPKAYAKKLKGYVERVKRGGIKVIVLSSVTRRNFNANGLIEPRIIDGRTLADYAQAAKTVAEETDVPFIDFNSISIAHHNKIGPEASASYNFNEKDKTHFSKQGAKAIADMIITELKKVASELTSYLSCHAVEEKPVSKSDLVQKLEGIFNDASFAKIPEKVFSAVDYGVKSDGKTVNTKALQAAIDAAYKAKGGVVTLPQGTTVSGALFLKSNVELRLAEGAVLQAVHDDAEFPDKWTRIAGIEMDWPAALINIYEQENVRITGKGIIDGNGSYWWKRFNDMRKIYEKKGLRWAVDYDAKRVRPIVVYKSKNVFLKDFTVKRAGFWTITFIYSHRVHADGITIRNNIGGHGPSTDGINTDSSSNVLIENCDVDCNDDNFCIKAGRDSDGLRVNIPTENVVIRNCKTGRGQGLFTLGSETSGGMNNIEVYGLKAKGTRNGFRLKSAKVRGGSMRNVWIHDIKMDQVTQPFHWELNWFPSYSYPPLPKNIPESEWPAHWKVMLTKVTPPERGIPEFYNIRISDVEVTGANKAFHANAYAEKPLRNVHWENVTIEAKSGGNLKNAKDWTMTNVVLRAGSQVKLRNCTNVQLPQFKKQSKPFNQKK